MKKPAAHKSVPTVAGAPFAGGYYVGRFFVGTQAYALVVAPTSDESDVSGAWNKNTRKVSGALNYNDGAANTEAMAKAGSAIAKAFRALTIGGHNDWYLPSRMEALLLSGEREHLEGDATIEDDWYWTSTQCALTAAYAWVQYFYYGDQYYGHKVDFYRARAVRRVKI